MKEEHATIKNLLLPQGEDSAKNPLPAAFIGDAVYEVLVRQRLVESGITHVHKLHLKAVRYVSAVGQAEAFRIIENLLTEKEMSIFKSGRNCNSTKPPKNAKVSDYRAATGIETLFGVLFLNGETNRLLELFEIIWEEVDNCDEHK